MRKINDLLSKNKKKEETKTNASSSNINESFLSKSLNDNLKKVRETIGESIDIIIRPIYAGKNNDLQMAIIFIEGMTDQKVIQTTIIEPLVKDEFFEVDIKKSPSLSAIIMQNLLPVHNIQPTRSFEKIFTDVLSGNTVLLVDKLSEGLSIDTKGTKGRPITEPNTQSTVKGPKEAFTESFSSNLSLIRKRIKDTNLRIETKPIGTKTKTNVAILYLKGTANDKIVEEVRRRLSAIKTDGILDSGYIEEYIQDKTYTPFPTIISSERPDSITANILEGRIAIIVDGSPFVLSLPVLFIEFFQAAEDYYRRYNVASFLRLLRYISFLISLLTPALYIAITTFHREMLPTTLLITIAAQREGVPFPAGVEASMMVLTFDILLEAGIRMPRTIGPTISIVGALVLGQAAVQAGLITAAMVIVISITAISGFISPNDEMSSAIRLLRWLFIILSIMFGLYGITMGLFALILHMCSLRSFGVPYMAPLAPFIPTDQKDALIRLPRWALFSRPHLINKKDMARDKTTQPRPERGN